MTTRVTLKGLRMARGYTQDQVAGAARVDRGVYNALENGRRKLTEHYARKLEPVLGWDVWQIVTLQDAKTNGDIEDAGPSFAARLEALEKQVAGRDEDAVQFFRRLLILENAAAQGTTRLEEHDSQLQAIRERLDALAGEAATRAPRSSHGATAEAQG